MKISFLPQNKKTKFTRMCIGEAVIALLKETELKKLKIQAVARKAGVSRMTFYKYYSNIEEALEDYLQIVISEYVEENDKASEMTSYRSYEHILYSLNFFDQYATFFVTMKKQGLYSNLIDSVNKFLEKQITIDEQLSVYELYSYAGGLLNTFLMWEEQGKKDPASEVAKMIYQLYCSK